MKRDRAPAPCSALALGHDEQGPRRIVEQQVGKVVAGAEAAQVRRAVNVADEAIATTEDFEDEAFAKISDKTYKADLEALKKEIEEP